MRVLRISFAFLLLFQNAGGFCMDWDGKSGSTAILFHLERNRDNDQVYYVLNLDTNGMIDSKDPIYAYWKKADHPQKQIPLTNLQQKYGYGVKIVSSNHNEVRFYLAAYPDRTFTAKQTEFGYASVVEQDGQEVTISKLFVHFKGMSFWNPVVLKIDVYGLNADRKEYLVDELKLN